MFHLSESKEPKAEEGKEYLFLMYMKREHEKVHWCNEQWEKEMLPCLLIEQNEKIWQAWYQSEGCCQLELSRLWENHVNFPEIIQYAPEGGYLVLK